MDLSDLASLISQGSMVVGTATGQPEISVAGGLLGAGLGAAAKSQAKNQVPPEADPRQLDFLSQLDRMRRSFETGSAYSAEKREMNNLQSAVTQGVVRAAGGQSGLAIAGINRAGQSALKAYGDIAAQGEQREDMFTQMYGSYLDKAAERKLDIQNLKYNQGMVDAGEANKANLQYLYQFLSAGGAKDFSSALKNVFSSPASPSLSGLQSIAPPPETSIPTPSVGGLVGNNPFMNNSFGMTPAY